MASNVGNSRKKQGGQSSSSTDVLVGVAFNLSDCSGQGGANSRQGANSA